MVWHSGSCGAGPLISNDGERRAPVTTGNACEVKRPLGEIHSVVSRSIRIEGGFSKGGAKFLLIITSFHSASPLLGATFSRLSTAHRLITWQQLSVFCWGFSPRTHAATSNVRRYAAGGGHAEKDRLVDVGAGGRPFKQCKHTHRPLYYGLVTCQGVPNEVSGGMSCNTRVGEGLLQVESISLI